MESTATLNVCVSDVSDQKRQMVENVPTDATIGELRESLLETLNLPRTDSEGEPMNYQVYSTRTSRHLGSTELVGETVEDLDTLRLSPEINAA